MTRDERIDAITAMCTEHNCKPKIRQIHFEQYVDRQWHPHPPQNFIDWWEWHQDHAKHGIKSKVAWNCQSYRDEYMEAKKYGAVSAS